MSSHQIPSTFTAGQRVTFEGRAGVILRADAEKRDALGNVAQLLVVKTYAGEHMIGSRHSKLAA